MKQYTILHSFNGSQTGLDCSRFEAGTVAKLSDSLAAVAVAEGWAVEVEAPAPVIAEPKAEDREIKVEEPEETKPAKAKKGTK